MKKILWIDLEMSGLDVDKELILEVAAIVTDLDLNELGQFESVLNQPQKVLDEMDAWNTKHHTESGLLERVKNGEPPHKAEQRFKEFIESHFSGEPAIIAGNSISQDRLFIKKYFKTIESLLHYRMLDVSSWKIIFKEKYGYNFPKQNQHRALQDIQESISELKAYLQFVQVNV